MENSFRILFCIFFFFIPVDFEMNITQETTTQQYIWSLFHISVRMVGTAVHAHIMMDNDHVNNPKL